MERATAFAMSLDKDCSPSPGRTRISSKAGAIAALDLRGPWFLQWPNEARASSDPRKQKDPRDQLLLDRSVQKPGRLLADLTEQVATRAKEAMGLRAIRETLQGELLQSDVLELRSHINVNLACAQENVIPLTAENKPSWALSSSLP